MADPRADSSGIALHVLEKIQSTLQKIQIDFETLTRTVDTIKGRVTVLSGLKEVGDVANLAKTAFPDSQEYGKETVVAPNRGSTSFEATSKYASPQITDTIDHRSAVTSRIILTTYPGQAGIDPLVMNWGHKDPMQRGPVVVSRNKSTIRRRNGAAHCTKISSRLLTSDSKQSVPMEALIRYIMHWL